MDLSLTVNAVRRLARRVHMRLGATGLMGAALLAVASMALVYAARAQRESEWTRARVAQIDLRRAEQASPAERLAKFQNWFPNVDTTTADLRKIFKAADASHVALAKGEYSLTPIEGSGGLQRFDVILPVKEHYGPVKNFVADVLNALPHASLVELHVERPGAGADQVDSRVHFTLFYRAQS
jgi:hypothetical protein